MGLVFAAVATWAVGFLGGWWVFEGNTLAIALAGTVIASVLMMALLLVERLLSVMARRYVPPDVLEFVKKKMSEAEVEFYRPGSGDAKREWVVKAVIEAKTRLGIDIPRVPNLIENAVIERAVRMLIELAMPWLQGLSTLDLQPTAAARRLPDPV
jgi:hypothetical protein